MKSVLAIAGSLRAGSYNLALMRGAASQAPDSVTVRIYQGLGDVPLFNEDIEHFELPSVRALRDLVAAADGLLLATPEYNWGIPGVLKNAVDWLSRPPEVLIGKPVAIIGASSGRWGTRLAQAALRQVMTATESLVMPAPALFVRDAATMFDDHGQLIDAGVRAQLDAVLAAFATWIDKTQQGPLVVRC